MGSGGPAILSLPYGAPHCRKTHLPAAVKKAHAKEGLYLSYERRNAENRDHIYRENR
jgi:hypothetical protein